MIVGLTGCHGSGKTTIKENILISSNSISYKSFTMSNKLKLIGLILGFQHEELYGDIKQKEKINKLWNISGREFMQKMGTEIFRENLPNYLPTMNNIWIKMLDEERKKDKNKDKIIIVDDIYFKDEGEYVRNNGGIIIKIIRKGVESKSDHKSEKGEIKYDFLVNNIDNDIDNTTKKIIDIINKVKK